PKPKASARRKRGGYDSSTTPLTTVASPRPITTVAAAPRLTAATKGKQPARATSPNDPSEVERTEAEQLKIVLRRSRQETHISQHGGSSTDDGTEDVDAQDKGRDDDEGEKNEESDAERDDNDDDDDDKEEIAKMDEQEDTNSGEGDDEETESDGESEEEETIEEEEESFDPIPRTPEDSKDDGNSEDDQGLRVSEEQRLIENEEADELYRDVDISQGRGLQVSQDIEDSHVTLTPVIPDGVESIFTTASSSIAPLQTSTLIMTPSTIATITTSSDAPIHPKTIPSAVLQNFPTFDSVFRFEERVKSLEVNFSEFMQTNQFAEAVSNILDKTILESYGDTAILKKRRGDDDDQEGPSAGSDRGLTELEYHLEEVYKATTDQLDWVNPEGQQYLHNLLQPLLLIPDNRGRRVIPFSHFINNDLEYLRGGASSRKYTTSVTKTKAADYGHIKWIEDLFYGFAVNRESVLDVYSKRRIITVTDLKIVKWHNYKHLDWISVRRDDDKIYKFKEGDFKRLHLQDIEDMLLLLVQGKLSNLTVEEPFSFNVYLRMFTRSIVIQRRFLYDGYSPDAVTNSLTRSLDHPDGVASNPDAVSTFYIQCADLDTRPPMLDRTDFASWQQRVHLCCRRKENRVNILKSIDEGPFKMATFQETLSEGNEGALHLGPERPRVYYDLSPEEKGMYNADIQATNILLQGLPKDIYTFINHYTDAKDIWDNVNMLLEDKAILSGADNRPPMLEKDMYDYWKSRMELYMLNRQHRRMILELVEQAKELWERILMLMQGTSLTKQERECKLYDEFDKFAYRKGETLRDFYLRFSLLLNDVNMYNMKLEQFQVNTKFLNTLPPEWTPQIDYAPMVQHSSEYSPPETGLVVLVFQKGDDPIDAINHMMSFLTAVVTSSARNPRGCEMQNDDLDAYDSDCDEINSAKIALMVNWSHYGSNNLAENSTLPALQDDLILSMIEQLKTQVVNCTKINQDNKQVNELLTTELERKGIFRTKDTILKNDFQKEESRNIHKEIALEKQALGFQNPCNLKKAQQLKPKLYDGRIIEKSDAVVIPDTEETLMLAEERRSEMIEKQNDPKMTEKKVITKPIDYAILNQLSTDFETRFVPQTELSVEQAFWSQYSVQTDEPNLSASPTIVEVSKELPKVSMVNSFIKKLKFHLASFDMVVKERTTATVITDGTWGFEHTKACCRDVM
nr:integrase, catalytic region, zinc finger, CCHC-type, peptidase aspartic, catalytic [Tanacetum cinerariifolium]